MVDYLEEIPAMFNDTEVTEVLCIWLGMVTALFLALSELCGGMSLGEALTKPDLIPIGILGGLWGYAFAKAFNPK